MTLYLRDSSSHTNYLGADQAHGLTAHTCKITDGDHWYEDPTFKQQTDRARGYGIKYLGSYHVVWGNRSLSSQADWWVQRAFALAPDVVMWQPDCEPFGYNVAPTIDQVNSFGDMVCARAKVAAGAYTPYCPAWVYGSSLQHLRYRNLWNSNYGANPTGAYKSIYTSMVGDNSSRWNSAAIPTVFLQYGSNTDIGDANAYRGTLEQFLAQIGVTSKEGEMQQVLVRYTDAPSVDGGITPGYMRVFIADGMQQVELPSSFFVLPPGGLLSPKPGIIGNDGTHADGMLGNLGNGGQIFLVGEGGWTQRAAWGTMSQIITGGGLTPADLDEAVSDVKAEVRDAVADLGEGGAAQVRDDPDA
jgi:hypothetical protein